MLEVPEKKKCSFHSGIQHSSLPSLRKVIFYEDFIIIFAREKERRRVKGINCLPFGVSNSTMSGYENVIQVHDIILNIIVSAWRDNIVPACGENRASPRELIPIKIIHDD